MMEERERTAGERARVRREPGDQAAERGALAESRQQRPDPEERAPDPRPPLVLLDQLEGNAASDQRPQHRDQHEVQRRQGDTDDQRHAGPERQGNEHEPRLVAVPDPRYELVHLAPAAIVTLEQREDPDPEVVAVQNYVHREREEHEDHPCVGQPHAAPPSGLATKLGTGPRTDSMAGSVTGPSSGPWRTTRATYQT